LGDFINAFEKKTIIENELKKANDLKTKASDLKATDADKKL